MFILLWLKAKNANYVESIPQFVAVNTKYRKAKLV